MTSQSASLLGDLPSPYLWKCTQRGFAGNLVSQAFSGQNWGPMSVPALTPRSALSGVALLRARLSGRHSGGSDAGSQAVISAGIRRTGCSAHFP